MEIRHRIAFNGDTKPEFKAMLDELGIRYDVSPLPGHSVGLVFFDAVESDSNWSDIATLVREFDASDVFNTFFSSEEVLSAEWVRIVPAFEQGYPQPEDGWEKVTYSGECSRCGAGYAQKAPFLLAKEPRLGKHDFMCLYWTYTFFCAARVREALKAEQVHGYEMWDVLLRKDRRPSEILSQLWFPIVAKPGLSPSGDTHTMLCSECGIVKYSSHLRGLMQVRVASLHHDTDIQTSYEWFGSGHAAFREVFVSRRVAQIALQQKWRGIQLKPLALLE